jgi:hypothetical protein
VQGGFTWVAIIMGILMSVVSLLILVTRFMVMRDGGLPDAGVGTNSLNHPHAPQLEGGEPGCWEAQQAKAIGADPIVKGGGFGHAAAAGRA